jgi:hypothetical protein
MDVYLAQGRIIEKVRKRYAYKFGGLQLGRKLQATVTCPAAAATHDFPGMLV